LEGDPGNSGEEGADAGEGGLALVAARLGPGALQHQRAVGQGGLHHRHAFTPPAEPHKIGEIKSRTSSIEGTGMVPIGRYGTYTYRQEKDRKF